MADLNAPIKPKKSSTAGEVPQAADLEVAEIAVNTADGKLFVKHTDNSIKEISGGGAATTLDNVGDVQYYVPPGSYDGLTNSTGSTSSAALTTSGQWYVPTNGTYFMFHEDQSTDLSVLQVGDEVTFEAYGLSHTATITVAPAVDSGIRWSFQINPGFSADWKGPTMPSGQAVSIINDTRFPNTTPDNPLDKQALIWNTTDSEWQPTSTIQSVNGQIGDAVIGVEELDSYAGWLKYNVISSGSLLPDAGEAIIDHASGWDFYLSTTDADGTSDGGGLGTLANGDPGQIKLNDGTLVDVTVNSTGNNTGGRLTVNFIDDSFLSSVSNGDVIYIQFASKAYGLSAADGQVLTWVDASNQWEPADAPADAVSSVNGQTGVVSLVLSDLSDVGTATGGTPFRYNNEVAGSASVVADGDWVYTSGIIVFDHIDADGQDATTGLYNQLSATGNPSSGSIWVSTDGVTFTEEAYTATFNFGDTDTRYGIATATSYSGSGEIWIAATEPITQASDGQVLTWVDANSRWEPVDASNAVDSVNGQTGAVSLGLEELDDFEQNVLTATWTFNALSSNAGGMVSEKAFNELYTLNFHPVAIEGDQKARLRAWIATLAATHSVTLIINGVEQSPRTINVTQDNMDDVAAYKPRLRLAHSTVALFNTADEFVGQTVSIKEFNTYLNANYGGTTDGQSLAWNSGDSKWKPVDVISKATLQAEVAASTDFADFQSRIAAL